MSTHDFEAGYVVLKTATARIRTVLSILLVMASSACGGNSVGDLCRAGTRDDRGVCVTGGEDAGVDDEGATNDSGVHWDGKPLPNVVYGAVNGRQITGSSVNFMHGSDPDGFPYGLAVTLSSSAMMCAEGTDHLDAEETRLTVFLLERYQGAAAAFVPGVLPVVGSDQRATTDAVAVASLVSNSGTGTCDAYIESDESATGGSITVYDFGGDQSGIPMAFVASFDLQFGMGHLWGSFTGQVCGSDPTMKCH